MNTAPYRSTPGPFVRRRPFWELHREASLNWLALGLLLAAWNAAGDDSSSSEQRPGALRTYPCVSVRGVQRANSHKSVNEL